MPRSEQRGYFFASVSAILGGLSIMYAFTFESWPFAVLGGVFAAIAMILPCATFVYRVPPNDAYFAEDPLPPPPPPPVFDFSSCFIRANEDDAEQCAICLAVEPRARVVLPCIHSFHEPCITRWFRHKRRCPVCMRDPMVSGLNDPEAP